MGIRRNRDVMSRSRRVLRRPPSSGSCSAKRRCIAARSKHLIISMTRPQSQFLSFDAARRSNSHSHSTANGRSRRRTDSHALFLLQMHLRNLYKIRFRNKEVGKVGGFQTNTSYRFIAAILLVSPEAHPYSNFRVRSGTCLSHNRFLRHRSRLPSMNGWNIMMVVGRAEQTTKED